MPDLGIALNTVISSLNVNQQALSLISNNIANANSENYTRREIVQTSQVVNGISAGVQIEEVRRAVDDFVVTAARRQISNVGRYEVQSQFYDRLELYLGSPGSDNNITAQFDSFFARLNELSNSPEQASLRTNALQSATTLASNISGLANNIQTIRFDVDQEIDKQVDTVNNYLDTLASLNLSIKSASIGGGDKTSLFDTRDKVLSDLSKIIDVNVNISGDGSVTVALPQTELLSSSSRFKLSYVPASSVDSITGGAVFNPIQVQLLDSSGNPTGNALNLTPPSNDTTTQPLFNSGTLKGLLDMRDTEMPNLLAQLDQLTHSFADAFNAVQNDGSGFPPPSSLTGTRLVAPAEEYNFSGKMRLAVLGADGSPAGNNFGTGGLPPLTLDFDTMTSNGTAGQMDLNAIVKEINEYFGPPPAAVASMGQLNDFRLAAVSSNIASTHAVGNIVFSGNPGVGSTIQVGTQVYTMVANGTASNGANIELGTTLSGTLDNIETWLTASQLGTTQQATYAASGNTLTISARTAGDSINGTFALDANIVGGGTANINGAGAAANPASTFIGVGTSAIPGVDANGNFTFDMEMTNVSAQDAIFEVTNLSVNGGGLTGQTLGPFTSTSGLRQRTNLGGAAGGQNLTIAIPANMEEGGTFTVTANVKVTAPDGTVTTDTVTFTVTIPDPTTDITNQRYAATATGGGYATFTAPTSTGRYASASIVKADGSPAKNGEPGYLKITSTRAGTGIVFDELDSKESGTVANPSDATGRGFSHFFGLNDFFTTGDTLEGSAINFAVRDGYSTDASRLSTGALVRSNQPSDPNANPVFTYEMGIGSNQIASRLNELKSSRITFDPAGGQSKITLTFGGYSSEILSFAAISNQRVDASLDQEQTLYDAFQKKLDSSGGVNVDEELANSVLFQNNFNASARLITIISQMLDKMIESF